jgi:methyl coenzyme M reductase gamma subunit
MAGHGGPAWVDEAMKGAGGASSGCRIRYIRRRTSLSWAIRRYIRRRMYLFLGADPTSGR